MKIQLGTDKGSYSFVAATKVVTLNLPEYTITLDAVLAIIHANTGVLLYAAATPSLAAASFTPALHSSTLTLNASVSNAGMTDSDPLTVLINAEVSPGYDERSHKLIVGNSKDKFRDPFTSKDTTSWLYPTESGSQYARSRIDGNVAGESYLVISLSALVAGNDEWVMISRDSTPADRRFTVPFELEYGLSISQRLLGQDINVETVAVDASNNVLATTDEGNKTISQAVVATNVATITVPAGHNFYPGDWVVISGFADSRLNVGPVVVTARAINGVQTTFTVAITIANATYTAGTPVVRRVYLCGLARYMTGVRWYGATAGNCDTISRNDDTRPRMVNWNPGNTQDTSVIPSEGVNYASLNYAQPHRARGSFHTEHTTKRILWRTRDIDSTATDRSQQTRRVPNPSHDLDYQVRIRAKNYPNFAVPCGGGITVAAKTGTTTATLTIPNHGLTTADWIVIYGIRDQAAASFPNVTTAIAVSSVVNANQITVIQGTAATVSSYGGFVIRQQGSQALPALYNSSIQTYAKTADGLRLILVGLGNWAETIGHTVTLYGLVNSANVEQTALYGRYRVAYQATTTIELEPVDGQDLTPVSTTPANAGGSIIRNTDIRLHYLRVYDRTRIETDSSTAGSVVESIPVNAVTMPTVAVNLQISNTAASVGMGVTVSNATLRVIPATEAMAGLINISELPILDKLTF